MAKSSKYWDNRKLQRLNEQELKAKITSNRIKKIYAQAFRNVNRDIASVYKNYSKTTGVDVQKLKTLLSKKETDKTWKTLKRQGLDKYIQDNYKSRINRLEQIQAQIYGKAKLIYPKEELEQKMLYKGVINDSYYKAIYDTQMGTGFDFSFNKLDNRTIENLLTEKWQGNNYSKRIWNNTDILADSVSELVGGALLSGQSYAKTSRQLRDKFNVAKYYSDRLVRTETNYFHNQVDAMAYEDMGIDKYVFVATLDSRTSEICQEMDNKVFDYKDMAVGDNYPPLHPNCRSTTRGYLGKEAEAMLQRRAKNPETGKYETIPNISYKEWANKNKISNTFSMGKTKSKNEKLNFQENINDFNKNSIKKSLYSNKTRGKNIDKYSNILIRKYYKNNKENLAMLDNKTGNLVGKISTGHNRTVTPTLSNMIRLKKSKANSYILIHNHPKNYSFSLTDIKSYVKFKSIETMIVKSPDYTFYLKAINRNIKNSELEKLYYDIEKKIKGKYKKFNGAEIRDLTTKELSRQMGWIYEKEKNNP